VVKGVDTKLNTTFSTVSSQVVLGVVNTLGNGTLQPLARFLGAGVSAGSASLCC
jgi:hypothetical protein